jgi:hypothetical protein
MDDIDPETLDAEIETERQWLISSLRRIADRLEALSLPRRSSSPSRCSRSKPRASSAELRAF